MPHTKLFIPGPVEVSEKTWQAFRKPMIGHRGKGFQDLYARIQPRLRELCGTTQPVFLCTGSAWCVMEAALRNLVRKKVLVCMSGAFSDKWYDVALKCGKQAEKLQVEWGQPILAADVEAKLAAGGFDAVTLIHNETSTGTLNPLEEIAAVVKKFPEVMFIVDTVSSFSTMRIGFDALGIDVMLAGVQKAMALPPGAAVFTVSERAYARAAEIKDRGYYMDFLEFRKNGESSMTPTTPSISHFYALESKLDDIFTEGLEQRYARHRETRALVHAWVARHGFELFPPAAYASPSLTCVKNTRGIDVAKLIAWLKETHHCIIDGGYGKIKGSTFRISSMGDETPETIGDLLGWLDEGLAQL
jgi:aspartate aminotransferase-like enzyme